MDTKPTKNPSDRSVASGAPREGELQKLEESIERVLIEQERSWEALATLSHKINNPLTSLIGRVQLLRQRGHEDPYVRRAAEVIEESSMRVAEYLREIAAVVKQRRAELRRAQSVAVDPSRRGSD